MNKNLKTLLLTSTLLATLTIAANNANAATVVHQNDTDTSIGFGDGFNKPDYNGDLSLVYVPLQFDFGVGHEPAKGAKTYSWNPALKQYVAVSDFRTGETGSELGDWSLKASMDAMQNDDASKTLAAQLQFNVNAPQKFAFNPETDLDGFNMPKVWPTDGGVLSDLDATTAAKLSNPTNAVVLTGSNEVSVLDYDAGATPIVEDQAYAAEISQAKLRVTDHSNVDKTNFRGKVNWVLSNEP